MRLASPPNVLQLLRPIQKCNLSVGVQHKNTALVRILAFSSLVVQERMLPGVTRQEYSSCTLCPYLQYCMSPKVDLQLCSPRSYYKQQHITTTMVQFSIVGNSLKESLLVTVVTNHSTMLRGSVRVYHLPISTSVGGLSTFVMCFAAQQLLER